MLVLIYWCNIGLRLLSTNAQVLSTYQFLKFSVLKEMPPIRKRLKNAKRLVVRKHYHRRLMMLLFIRSKNLRNRCLNNNRKLIKRKYRKNWIQLLIYRSLYKMIFLQLLKNRLTTNRKKWEWSLRWFNPNQWTKRIQFVLNVIKICKPSDRCYKPDLMMMIHLFQWCQTIRLLWLTLTIHHLMMKKKILL